ncbi:MAG: hypothetical protein AAGJ81_15145 [Verrucomicrobiota bacterium]
MNKFAKITLVLVTFLFVGCPRPTDVEVYNNTGTTLLLSNGRERKMIPPGESAKIRFRGGIEVESDLGVWFYERKLHAIMNSPKFFDGTLRIQLEADGKAYALPVDIMPPADTFEDQPNSFPYKPVIKGVG